MRILIVEDDPGARMVMDRILSKYGKCDLAVNGQEGVDAFNQALKDEQPYDLVLMDIIMPVMNGLMALKKMRDIEAGQGIWGDRVTKVIMATAVDDSDSVIEAYGESCEIYLVKPVNQKSLVKALQELNLLP